MLSVSLDINQINQNNGVLIQLVNTVGNEVRLC